MSRVQRMNVLVTGGAGYIGSHICVELLNAGHNVIVVDNLSNSKSIVLDRIRTITGKAVIFHELDLMDRPGLNELFAKSDIEFVIHLAGLKAVGESVMLPHIYYGNNVTGTINLCQVMIKHNVKNIVFSSSAAVYGYAENLPILESSKVAPVNPYGRTKAVVEDLLIDLFNSDPEWCITILRYFNPVGAHETGLIGEDPNGIPNNLMPYISQVATGKLAKLSIYGGDYPTKDGTGIRDYLHIVDLANGHLQAMNVQEESKGVFIYNLGTGRGYSVLEMVAEFEKVSGVKIPYEITHRRQGDVAESYTDPGLAEKELNWSAKLGLTNMCEDTWRWEIQNQNDSKTCRKL